VTSEETKITIDVSFLTKDVKMWWRRRVKKISLGNMMKDITTWEKMKEALIAHFEPQDETWRARAKVKSLKQTRSL